MGSRGDTGQPPRLLPVVAPKIAQQIVTRRAVGDSVAVIGRDLHLTPGEVASVLHTAEANAQRPSTAGGCGDRAGVMQARDRCR